MCVINLIQDPIHGRVAGFFHICTPVEEEEDPAPTLLMHKGEHYDRSQRWPSSQLLGVMWEYKGRTRSKEVRGGNVLVFGRHLLTHPM